MKRILIHCKHYSDAMLMYEYLVSHGKNANFDIDFCLAQYGEELCFCIIDDEVLCNTYDYFLLKQYKEQIVDIEDCGHELFDEIGE